MPKTQINTGYLPSTGTVEGFYTLFHSNTGVLNMDLLRKIYLKKKKKKKPGVFVRLFPEQRRGKVFTGMYASGQHVMTLFSPGWPLFVTTLSSPEAREIDISFTNIPGIFFSRPDFFGPLFIEKTGSVSCAPSCWIWGISCSSRGGR